MKSIVINLISDLERIWLKLKLLAKEKKYQDMLSSQVRRKYQWKIFRQDKLHNEGITLCKFKDKSFLFSILLGDAIETRILTHGIWDEELLMLMSNIIDHSPDGVVIDIGANVGAITIPLANYYSNIIFYCFEPHPFIFRKLNKNIQINKLKNVVPIQSAISDKEGEINFFAQIDDSNMGLSSMFELKNLTQKVVVKSITLDTFVANTHINKISLVKVDVQGAEIQVLKGMTKVIKELRPVVCFEHEDNLYLDGSDEIKKWITNFMHENNYLMFQASSQLFKYLYYPLVDLKYTFNGNIIALPM